MEKNTDAGTTEAVQTAKKEMSNTYVAKQLLTNAKRLKERGKLKEEDWNMIRGLAIDIISEDI